MISFSSEKSRDLLDSKLVRLDLIESLWTQRTDCRCGLACIDTIVFAAEKVELHPRFLPQGIGAHSLEQKPLSSGRDLEAIDHRRDEYGGMSLLDVQELGLRYFSSSEIVHSCEISLTKFVEVLKSGLAREHYLIVQFLASKLGLKLNGHFCVVAGMDNHESYVLILDPARHKHKWYWLKVDSLYNSSKTIMDSTGLGRGLVHFWG